MVKGNQPSLMEAIETAFISQHEALGVDRQCQVEKSHGRTVGQIASVLPAKETVDLNDWPKCQTIGHIDSIRKVGDHESGLERRYYISSRALLLSNSLHRTTLNRLRRSAINVCRIT